MSRRLSVRYLTWALLGISMALIAPAVMAQAAKAEGKISVDGKAVAVASVSAVGYKSTLGQLVSVLVSDKPADAKAFAEDTRGAGPDGFVPGVFSGAWKSQHFASRFSGLTFTVNAGAVSSTKRSSSAAGTRHSRSGRTST